MPPPREHNWVRMTTTEIEVCSACGSYEGGTTTECPGRRMSYDTSLRVYRGEIDFRNGEWCNQPAAGMSHVYGTSRAPYEKIAPPDVVERLLG